MSPRRGLPDRSEARDARDLLPLTPLAFSILIALLEDDLHGYGIARRIADRDAGAVTLAPGNLYAALDRLIVAGLVAPVPARAAHRRDGRGREYRITPFGREVATLEAGRLQRVLRTARRLAILPGSRQVP
jgi:DNA-binding PadR family transcriptional regulator